ncbi:MAG: YggT family protein [Alphaproteobacteria bacterium]|nr:YggT family protein [Alphaproteobacteria bacterium]
MPLIADLLILALSIYSWIIIASVIVSWLIAFEVINTRNPQARNLVGLLNRVTEPVFKPIRKYVPPIGGIDLTPIIVIIGIYVLQHIIGRLMY